LNSDSSRRRAFRGPGPLDFGEYTVGEPFYSGDYKYVVEVGSPLIPVQIERALNNPLSTLFWLIFGLPISWVCDRFDPRTRVSISRARPRAPFFRMVYVEYIVDVNVATARQEEIRKTWLYGAFDSTPPLTRKQVLAIRRQTRQKTSPYQTDKD
jgi:hypothetical protein